MDAETLAGVRAKVEAEAGRKLAVVSAENGRLPADVLLGLKAGTEDLIATRRSHHEIHHADGHEHDHEDFESFVAEGGEYPSVEALAEGLKGVIAAHDVLRLKGFAAIQGKPMRLVVQAVGQRIETYFDRPFAPGEARASRFVVIGLHDAIEDGEGAIREAIAVLAEAGRAAAE